LLGKFYDCIGRTAFIQKVKQTNKNSKAEVFQVLFWPKGKKNKKKPQLLHEPIKLVRKEAMEGKLTQMLKRTHGYLEKQQ